MNHTKSAAIAATNPGAAPKTNADYVQPYLKKLLLLSDREYEVFLKLGEGEMTKVLATDLFVSVKTMESHFAHIREKLGIKGGVVELRGLATRFAVYLETHPMTRKPVDPTVIAAYGWDETSAQDIPIKGISPKDKRFTSDLDSKMKFNIAGTQTGRAKMGKNDSRSLGATGQ